jgi:pimeloyl-ACP methyl ester carboxylesterase
MGSRLFDTVENRFVWGDRSMLDYVPLRLGDWFQRMNDRSGRVVPRGLTCISLPLVSVDPYSPLIALLNAQIGAGNLFLFDYDWRQANETSAAALKRRLEGRWPEAGAGGEARVTIIAHSMGGLPARCYIEQLGGSRFVKRLITIGGTHHGAPDALHALLIPGALGRFILPASILPPGSHVLLPVAPLLTLLLSTLQRMIGNLPSIYQLLPDSDFLYPGLVAGAPEPIAATYARLATSPALDPILGTTAAPRALVRDPRAGGVAALRALNHRLNAAIPSLGGLGVQYVAIAAGNHDTVRASRYVGGTTFVPLGARCGDGTVPIESAILPPGGVVHRVIVSSAADHVDMLREPAIMRMCLDLIGGRPAPMTMRPVCPPGLRPRLPIIPVPGAAELLSRARVVVP